MMPGEWRRVAAVAVLAILVVWQGVEGKTFTRCQLVKELLKQNYQKTFISNWVCLIEQESQRNTSMVKEKSNGSSNYGLFQINSKRWCKTGKKGGECNIACEDLLNDDITNDAVCANKIFELEGFKEWSGWMKRCKGQRLPDVEKCPEFQSPRSTPEKDTPKPKRSYVHG